MEGFGDFDQTDGFTNQNEGLDFSNTETPADPFLSSQGMSMSNQNNSAPTAIAASGLMIEHLTAEEEAMISEEAARQQEMQKNVYEKQMKEDQLKQERRAEAQKKLQEWADERTNSISNKKQENARNMQDQVELDKALSSSNPWERVVDNCEMDPNVYAGEHDVTRLRQVMISRKGDIAKKGK